MNNALAVKLLESFVSAYERDNLNEVSLLVDITKISLSAGAPVGNQDLAYVEVTAGGFLLRNVKNLSLRDDLMHEVVNALHAGRKVDAIKLVRASAMIGLKDAKDIVESIKL